MGQKVNPTGYRTGVFLGWKSRWYAPKKEFAELLVEDQKIRRFIKTRTATKDKREMKMYPMISKIEIERTCDEVKVLIYSGRARDLTRNNNALIEELQEDIQNLVRRRVAVEVMEVGKPNLSAQLVAEDIGEQLIRRANFRRAMKRALELAMEQGAKGIKVQLSGRLGGADMSRTEKAIDGSIPLSTLRANIDYGFYEAKIAQGHIGIQVWINLGEYNSEGKSDGVDAETGKAPKSPKRSYKR